jgi:hypothetical protein
MLSTDPVYGHVELHQPVLLDLIHSRAIQRLHGVLQHGVSALIGITSPTTRFDHSLGVMLLTRRLGASLDEQIAALLHDVSHTAFSHVIDYVFHDHISQSYHEQEKAAYVAGTDLPQILADYGYDWRDLIDEERFSILEQPAPDLCADRLDYFLRDSLDLGLATASEVDSALDALAVAQGRVVVTDLDVARWLGYTFIQADKASWANFREVGLYELTARAIRRGLEIGIISEADLWGTDLPLWEKLQASTDSTLQHWLQKVDPSTRFVRDREAPTFRVSTKLRTIDPPVLINGEVKPLSMLDARFGRHRSEYLFQNDGKWPMRVS